MYGCSWNQPPQRALVAMIVVGAICCLMQYFWRTSYWHDEAFLVLNIADKNAAELVMSPLDHEQAAPPLFLLSLRACYVWLGSSELSLRLVPLLLGLASLPIFAFLAWRVLGGWVAVWAMALAALSNELIFQAATVKQYSGDVFVASSLLAIAAASFRPTNIVHRFIFIENYHRTVVMAIAPCYFHFRRYQPCNVA